MNKTQRIISSTLAILMATAPIVAFADDCGCSWSTPVPAPPPQWSNHGESHSNDNSNTNRNNNSSRSNSNSNSSAHSNSNATASNRNSTSQALTNTTVVNAGGYGYQGYQGPQNNLNVSTVGMGDGVNCVSSSLAVTGYDGATNGNGYGTSNSFGGSVSLVVPIGGRANKSCNKLSEEILMQRQAAFCVSLMNSGVDLDENRAPADLVARCAMFKRHSVVPQVVERTVVVNRPTTIVRRVVFRQPEQCDVNYTREVMVRDAREAKRLMHHTLGTVSQNRLAHLLNRLHRYCNSASTARALDDGTYLP